MGIGVRGEVARRYFGRALMRSTPSVSSCTIDKSSWRRGGSSKMSRVNLLLLGRHAEGHLELLAVLGDVDVG